MENIPVGVNEKYLRLMSRYLSYVVILGLAAFNFYQYQTMQKYVENVDKQKQQAIEFWREAYRKSSETYLLMIEKNNDEANRKNR